MAAPCAISPAPDRFASELLGFLDCQAVNLGSQGFRALATPGSSASLLLTALLTIFIALAGYRLLFGETPSARDGVLGFLKIGIALAFATSWPAYRTVVFDVVLRAPAELAGEIGRPAGLPGSEGGLASRLDGIDRSLRVLAIYGAGTPTWEQVEQANGVAPPLFANFDAFALGAARVTFLVGSLGAFALLRMSAGLLLAVGPLLVGFLLFPMTRGLAGGWLRGLVAATLGSVAVAVALGIELALLEPWLADLATRRAAGVAIPGVPVTVLATTTIFAFAVASLLTLATRVAFGLSLTLPSSMSHSADVSAAAPERFRQSAMLPASSASAGAEPRSRATAIVESISAAQRREERMAGSSQERALTSAGGSLRPADATPSRGASAAGGGSRRGARRVSSSAATRDMTT